MKNQHPALARALALQAKFNANAPPTVVPQIIAPVAQPVVVPDMLSTIETLRSLLIKATSGSASVHDDGAFQDAIARSGHLLLKAQGTDTTDIVARYDASLLEVTEDEADDDFGRYGRDD